MSLKETRKRGGRALLSIVVIAVAVYIGFEPLITNVPDGVAKSVISSSFGAIFVIILTMYLLNKQTEIEQESKKSERVFDEKVRLFREIMDITRDMLIDGKISREEVNRLPFPLIRLQMLAKDETIKSFSLVNQKLNEIYAEDEMEEVVISEEEKKLSEFLNKTTEELKIEFGEPDLIEITDKQNKNFVYLKSKLKIKCERRFEINPKNIVVGYSSKNCF